MKSHVSISASAVCAFQALSKKFLPVQFVPRPELFPLCIQSNESHVLNCLPCVPSPMSPMSWTVCPLYPVQCVLCPKLFLLCIFLVASQIQVLRLSLVHFELILVCRGSNSGPYVHWLVCWAASLDTWFLSVVRDRGLILFFCMCIPIFLSSTFTEETTVSSLCALSNLVESSRLYTCRGECRAWRTEHTVGGNVSQYCL